jgi:hypothetical protein
MNATRQKKLEYIRSFGQFALQEAVAAMLRRKEAPWLTDEQIDDITEQMVSDARWTQHNNMRNRSRVHAYVDAGPVSAHAGERV